MDTVSERSVSPRGVYICKVWIFIRNHPQCEGEKRRRKEKKELENKSYKICITCKNKDKKGV
jgi:hypothetical protein